MNMAEIKTKAKGLGIKVGKLRKGDLIRSIQKKEGNFPCFETAKQYCSQKACCWRDACLPGKKNKTGKAWEKKKKEYTKKVNAEIKDVKKQLADLEKKAKKLVGKGQKDALDEIGKTKEMAAGLKKRLDKYSSAGEDAWKIAKKGMDDAWTDLRKAFTKATKKFK